MVALAFAGYLPVMIALMSVSSSESIGIGAAVSSMLLTSYFALRLGLTKCSSCDALFFCNWSMNALSNECVHCGFKPPAA
jgi:hypothetical protein